MISHLLLIFVVSAGIPRGERSSGTLFPCSMVPTENTFNILDLQTVDKTRLWNDHKCLSLRKKTTTQKKQVRCK